MQREAMADLAVFAAVAEELNFTRAAARLGLSQSALSQIIKRLEARLGVRLLARTTRSVATTDAGDRLLQSLSPLLKGIEQSVADLSDFRDKPAGTVRITTVEHAAKTILLPRLARLASAYPDITVELNVDYGLADIVTDRFDAGVRLGEQVAKDMIAVPIGPRNPMAIVGSPAYFEHHAVPAGVEDLVKQRCINLRLPTSDSLYAWQLVEEQREVRARVEGPFILNTLELIVDAALAGAGLAYVPLDQVSPHLEAGRLHQVLQAWTSDLPAYHLYYPSRRHVTPAFRLVVDALRFRA
ncbi:MAG: LysR family transcriptional regulator [Devosia sp.]|nr:LysR family transcriptional regulator [Devosia sp.]